MLTALAVLARPAWADAIHCAGPAPQDEAVRALGSSGYTADAVPPGPAPATCPECAPPACRVTTCSVAAVVVTSPPEFLVAVRASGAPRGDGPAPPSFDPTPPTPPPNRASR